MNHALGAGPMPIVYSRRSPSRARISANSASSLPTAPSVRNTTCRSPPVPASPASAAVSAGSISVPPRARSPATKRFACATVAGSTGIGAPNSERVAELNSITLNRSPGANRSSAQPSASRACAIDTPSIEPEVSTT